MTESFESMPFKPETEKASVEDFHLEIGDVLISETGTRRTIQEIIKGEEYPGGGYFEVERQDLQGNKSPGKLSFETFLKQQDVLMSIERVAKKETPLATPARTLSAREKAALKQIESQLGDANTSEDNQAFLRKSQQEIFSVGEEDEDQTQVE